jgi:1-deoxy-D-xylulose-5-phosphate reductoisomerase
MGAKITVDSATLMNKGLEVIEAHHLFHVPYDHIEVLLHPRSLVHALVRLVDGALLAHLGLPDMRVPLAYALHYPSRRRLPVERLDLAEIGTLEFDRPDAESFPALELARQAGRSGDAATCALNAANEVAVYAFLSRRIPFVGIPQVVARVLEQTNAGDPRSYEEIAALDARSRQLAEEACRAGSAAWGWPASWQGGVV